MNIDIVMPVWITGPDTVSVTENAVNSLRQTAPNARLIIVDNGSTTGLGAIRDWADLYIRNKYNLGYAKAVNQGLSLSNDFVAVANNDIRVSPGWVKEAERVFADPEVGSLHFRMIPYDQPFSSGKNVWIGGKERWCTSSFFVVRNVQKYDEKFFNSLDDWDFWKRMRQAGYKQAYTNIAEYQHLDSHSQQKIASREENDRRNREYFVKKHGDLPEVLFEKEFPGQLAKPWLPQP